MIISISQKSSGARWYVSPHALALNRGIGFMASLAAAAGSLPADALNAA